MDIASNILGGGMKSTPVFLYNTLVDIDLSIIQYFVSIKADFIDYEKLKSMHYIELVGKVYRRKDINPLSLICIPDIMPREELDRLYREYSDKPEVLNKGILSDIESLIVMFNKTAEITPCILCTTENQLNSLDRCKSLDGIQKNTIKDINLSKKTEVYMKFISDLQLFDSMTATTFYISSCGVNLVEDNTDLNMTREDVIPIVEKRNKINIFDMYRMDIIGRYKHG